MELRQLKYFTKAAETLNFSEAAKALYITQSTLSQQIRQLETELDVQLFHRNSHEVTLTEAGAELLPYAKETLYAAETCKEHIRDLQQLLTGTLNIHYKTMEELMQMLVKREVDFVLAFKPTRRYEQVESHILFDNHLSVVVRSDHELARKAKIRPDELERYEFAMPGKGLQARNTFDQVFAERAYHFKVRVELNEVNILLKLIRKSNLVTILSEATIHDEPGVKAIPLDVEEYEMEGCIHTLKNAYRKHSALKFIHLLSESNAIRKRMHTWLE